MGLQTQNKKTHIVKLIHFSNRSESKKLVFIWKKNYYNINGGKNLSDWKYGSFIYSYNTISTIRIQIHLGKKWE